MKKNIAILLIVLSLALQSCTNQMSVQKAATKGGMKCGKRTSLR